MRLPSYKLKGKPPMDELALDPRRTALVLIDLQKGILPFGIAPHPAATVLANAATLATRFRALSAPVVLVRVGWTDGFPDVLKLPVDQAPPLPPQLPDHWRSEEHTSELQSLMRISYAVFCLKKKNKDTSIQTRYQ